MEMHSMGFPSHKRLVEPPLAFFGLYLHSEIGEEGGTLGFADLRHTLHFCSPAKSTVLAKMTTGHPAIPGIRTVDGAQIKHESDPFYFGVNPTAPTQTAGSFQGMYGVPAGPGFSPNVYSTSKSYSANWRENDAMVQGLRTRNVVLIELMLSNHAPHDVLTEVPENVNWHSKTFQLAVKIERLMFTTATSREDYINETTLRTRVQNVSRNLIQLRKRKNMISEKFATLSMN